MCKKLSAPVLKSLKIKQSGPKSKKKNCPGRAGLGHEKSGPCRRLTGSFTFVAAYVRYIIILLSADADLKTSALLYWPGLTRNIISLPFFIAWPGPAVGKLISLLPARPDKLENIFFFCRLDPVHWKNYVSFAGPARTVEKKSSLICWPEPVKTSSIYVYT